MLNLIDTGLKLTMQLFNLTLFRDELTDTLVKVGLGALGMLLLVLMIREVWRFIVRNKFKLTFITSAGLCVYYFVAVYKPN